jgi:hypothetical protein
MSQVVPDVCELVDKQALAHKKDAMVSQLMERDGFRDRMPKCFAKGMPLMIRGCFEHFFPELSKEERREFIAALVGMLLEYGTRDFSDEEKQALLQHAQGLARASGE